MLRVPKEQKQTRNGYRGLVESLEETERAWAKRGKALRAGAAVPLNGARAEVDAAVIAGLLEGAVPNETVSLLRALLGRFAEIPPLAAAAAALSSRLDAGVPDGGWNSFLRTLADAVGEAVNARESQRELDDFLEQLTLQLEDIEHWTRWQAGAAQSRRADAAGLELTVQAETARLRREVVISPTLGHLKTKMKVRLDSLARELLEFRRIDARRQDEHERRASELSKEIAELKSRTDELIELCAEQEARLMIDALTGCHSRYAY